MEQSKGDLRRDEILRAAARLFREKGYATTTVRKLGDKVGILSGSLFHHFKTKEEILYTIMQEVITLQIDTMRSALETPLAPRDKLRTLIKTELEALHGDRSDAFMILITEWRNLSEANAKKILRLVDEYEGFWLATLQEGKAAGLIEADPIILRRLLSGAIFWTGNWFKPGGRLNLDKLADETLLLAIKD